MSLARLNLGPGQAMSLPQGVISHVFSSVLLSSLHYSASHSTALRFLFCVDRTMPFLTFIILASSITLRAVTGAPLAAPGYKREATPARP